jgi:hypothetical protein
VHLASLRLDRDSGTIRLDWTQQVVETDDGCWRHLVALVTSGKTISIDEKFDSNESETKLSNYVFTRLVAKKKKFTNVNFRYSTFDACYLRDCHFDSCDFTGCRFTNSNLHESKFVGCKFDYATFEKTNIDPHILDTECPRFENLRLRFARTLRTNFQQLGDASAVNRAMRVELDATALHLWKAVWSSEEWYRRHYKGLDHLRVFFELIAFRLLDFIWGNGESIGRLMRFVLIVLAMLTFIDVSSSGNANAVSSYIDSFAKSFQFFFGALTPEDYSKTYVASITCVRLVVVGFFLSIIIKRLGWR